MWEQFVQLEALYTLDPIARILVNLEQDKVLHPLRRLE
jgi:hypothetical protein